MGSAPTLPERWRFEWSDGQPSLKAPADVALAIGVHGVYLGDPVLGRIPGFPVVAVLVNEANHRNIGAATLVAGMCHWVQNRGDAQHESHRAFHFGHTCPYEAMAAVLLGQPDPRDTDEPEPAPAGAAAGWVVVKRHPIDIGDFRTGQTVRLTFLPVCGVVTVQTGPVTVEGGSVRLGDIDWIDWATVDVLEEPAEANPDAEQHRAEPWRQGHPDQGGVAFGWSCMDCPAEAIDLLDGLAAERGADWHSKHPHGIPVLPDGAHHPVAALCQDLWCLEPHVPLHRGTHPNCGITSPHWHQLPGDAEQPTTVLRHLAIEAGDQIPPREEPHE